MEEIVGFTSINRIRRIVADVLFPSVNSDVSTSTRSLVEHLEARQFLSCTAPIPDAAAATDSSTTTTLALHTSAKITTLASSAVDGTYSGNAFINQSTSK